MFNRFSSKTTSKTQLYPVNCAFLLCVYLYNKNKKKNPLFSTLYSVKTIFNRLHVQFDDRVSSSFLYSSCFCCFVRIRSISHSARLSSILFRYIKMLIEKFQNIYFFASFPFVDGICVELISIVANIDINWLRVLCKKKICLMYAHQLI